jgi:anti-sigma-K factor RskA
VTDHRERDPELDALLGAYALDALDDDERARMDAYLERTPAARDELDELRESAASLALAPVDDLQAPPELWARISSSITTGDSERDELSARRVRRSSAARWAFPVGVAAAIAIVVLAGAVVALQQRLDDARSPSASALTAKFEQATRQDGARELALAPRSGSEVARLVLLPDGTGYLVNDDLSPLRTDQTYQLWVLMGDPAEPTVISAGVLGNAPTAAGFKTAGPVLGFALTVEHDGGVTSSTQPPVASGRFA